MILANLPLGPQEIIILIAVIIAAINAFLEKRKRDATPQDPSLFEEEDYLDPYQQYEAELERQRAAMQMEIPKREESPPPLPPVQTPAVQTPAVQTPRVSPVRPKLSPAEQAALKNLQLVSHRKSKSSGLSTKSRVKQHLSSPTAAREALLLAEVLGPPKALRENN